MALDGAGGVGSGVRKMFRTLSIASSGLSAQKARMETIARNIANAETTRTPDGGPYRRKTVRLEARRFRPDRPEGLDGVEFPELPIREEPEGGVEVAGVEESTEPGPLVYEPGHPDANEDGYVRYPNVEPSEEMTKMTEARRTYDANATVFQVAKAVLRRALEI